MIFKRNIALFSIGLVYILVHTMLISILFENKVETIKLLEIEHKNMNEKYITAQILSQQLKKVYTIIENNLSLNKVDEKNKESSMVFLKELTDILENLDIKLDQVIPGKKEKKGKIIKIPYQLQFDCEYEKLGEFITELESNNRIIIIDQLMIKNDIDKTRVKGNSQDNILNQHIEMKISTITLAKTTIL